MKARRELAKFPKLSGTLKQLLGHAGGYVRPKPGEPFQLDLKEVAKLDVSRRLDFDLKEKSYIPLPGPISVQEIHRYSNGVFGYAVGLEGVGTTQRASYDRYYSCPRGRQRREFCDRLDRL